MRQSLWWTSQLQYKSVWAHMTRWKLIVESGEEKHGEQTPQGDETSRGNLQRQPAPVSGGAGRLQSDRLEVGWRPGFALGRPDQHSDPGPVGATPPRPRAGRGRQGGDHHAEQQRDVAAARVRALDGRPQRRGGVRRDRLDAQLRAAGGQLVGRAAHAGAGQGAGPQSPEQHGQHHKPVVARRCRFTRMVVRDGTEVPAAARAPRQTVGSARASDQQRHLRAGG
jgi:hypothetical protein